MPGMQVLKLYKMINVKHLHIYTVLKKNLHYAEYREITDPTHSFWNITIELAKSSFYENSVFGISS